MSEQDARGPEDMIMSAKQLSLLCDMSLCIDIAPDFLAQSLQL